MLACRDYYGSLITIDFKTLGPSSYRIHAAQCLRDSHPELRILNLAYPAPYSDEEQHHFKLDDRHTTYYGFTRRGTFPRELTGDTVTFSSVTNYLVIVVYENDDSRSRFAVALTYYLGQASVHVVDDQCSVHQEVSWAAFAKKAYDLLWVAPVESRVDSGVKCAHLPRSIWDARVVWDTRIMQTDVMVDVEHCPGCCIGPRECTIVSNDRNNLDTPGFMWTVHNRGLKLDGKDVWLCECSGQKITLGDYGMYFNGSFKLDGNIFEDMHAFGIDPADPAYRPVISRVSSDAHILQHARDRLGVAMKFRPQGEQATLHPPQSFSLPNNQQLVLLLKALSVRLSDKHLVMATIQYSNVNEINREGRRREAESDLVSTTGGHSTESGVFVPLCTIANPQVWRREPVCTRRRERFKTIRKHFYILANLHRPPGVEVGNNFENRRMKRGAIKFLSEIFGLEILKNYVFIDSLDTSTCSHS
ncbi:hypothetical protein EDD17DRAFT_1761239 [Pisolithus thermaeus]|nr:hypothetical protein EDD17DRAFT_1761239 [Pisolithus thermaeus]